MIKGFIVTIPVAIGNRPAPELEKIFPDEEVIKANDTDHATKIAIKIQDKLVDGNNYLVCFIYLTCLLTSLFFLLTLPYLN